MKKVTAAIWINKGKVLIARRPTGDPLAHHWEFPGGKIEQGESPERCLQREMAEEFNVQVTVGSFFGSSVYRYDSGSIELLAYFVSGDAGNLTMKAHEEIRWVEQNQLGDFTFAPADVPLVEKLQMYLY